jgi:hypothetical protein
MPHAQPISFSFIWSPENYKSWSSSLWNFLQCPPLYVQMSSSAPYSQTALACIRHSVLETKCQILIKQQAKL